MRSRVAAVVCCLLLAAPAAVLAQSTSQPDEGYDNYVSIYYNVNFGGKLYESLQELDARSSSQGFGAALTWWARGKFSAEVDVNYNPSFYDTSSSSGSNKMISATVSAIIGGWINQGRAQRVRPYVVIGGGLMRSSFGEFATVGWKTDENIGVVDVGGGLIYFFHPRAGFRVDVRYRYGVGANESEQGWGWVADRNFWRAAFGASFAFGQ